MALDSMAINLSVAISKWIPWISYQKTENGNINDLEGSMTTLLDQFTRNMNASFHYIEAPDKSWGRRLDNGSYNGMIGMVHRNEAHFAVGPFTITQERSLVVQFTNPIYMDVVTMLVGSQEEAQPLFFVLQVFQKLVWMSILLAFLFIVSTHVLIDLLISHKSSTNYLVNDASLTYFRPLTFTCTPLRQDLKLSQRLLFAFWLFATGLLCRALSGELLSYLVVTRPEDFVKSLDDFQRFPNAIPLLEDGSSFVSVVKQSANDGTRHLWDIIQQNPKQCLLSSDVIFTHRQFLSVLRDKRYVAITELSSVMAMLAQMVAKKLPCGFHLTALEAYGKPQSIALNKHLPRSLKERFTFNSLRLVDNGLIAQDIKQSSENYEVCLQILNNDSFKAIGFSDARGIFIIFLSGVGVSISLLILENVFHFLFKQNYFHGRNKAKLIFLGLFTNIKHCFNLLKK